MVQTYVAAHVPKKLLGTVWEQQLLPGPSNWGLEEMLRSSRLLGSSPFPEQVFS